MDKILRTQKDGRLFAIALLERIAEPARKGEFSAVEFQRDPEEGDFRFPPQSPMIREAFDRIYAASEEARKGFFVVMSEHIGGAFIGTVENETLRNWEAEGLMRESGPHKRHTTSAERRAHASVAKTQTLLCALQNFGQRFDQSPNDVAALRYAVKGLCDQIRAAYSAASTELTNKHPAVKHLKKAAGALDSLESFMVLIDDIDDGGAQVPTLKSTVRRMASEVICFYVALSGREMERAEKAMGESPSWGYLKDGVLEVRAH